MQFIRQRARLSSRSRLVGRACPRLEQLETRIVPYTVSGNAWPNPQLITLSFVPDGTNLGGAYSNLFAAFNAKWATSMWENQILRAAQVWAQQTNLNFTVISDSGADEGSGNYQQGDPTFGDIRVSGFNFQCSGLGMAYMPPPVNNYSIAGDLSLNTGQTFNINQTFDIFTVAAHEIGHALGLYHSSLSSAVMFGYYTGTEYGLTNDDIAGIRAIYSNANPRSYDAFNDANTSFSTAANLTGLINSNLTALETGLDISTTSQKEYFTITVPQGTNGTMTVTAQSSGLSLLAPSLTVYNSAETQVATKSGSGELGSTISLSISGVSAGQQYYVKVGGANTTSFGTGGYAMTFQFGSTTRPAVPLPNTQVLNGNPVQGGGGQAMVPGNIIGKDTSWDSYGLTDDNGSSANSPAPSANAVAGTLHSPVSPAPVAGMVVTGIASAHSAPIFAAANLNALPLLSPLAFSSQALLHSQANAGGLVSSRGNNAVDAVFEQDSGPQSLLLPDEAEVPAAANAEGIDTTSAQTVLPSVSWRNASDAYFTDQPLMNDSTGTSEAQVIASDEQITPLFEAAAAAAVVLALEPKSLGWRDNRVDSSGRPIRRLCRV